MKNTITLNLIMNRHNIIYPPNLSTILYEDHILNEKIKKVKEKAEFIK